MELNQNNGIIQATNFSANIESTQLQVQEQVQEQVQVQVHEQEQEQEQDQEINQQIINDNYSFSDSHQNVICRQIPIMLIIIILT